MSLEIGSLVEGEVTGIANFGAFVKLPEGNTGLIHISEIADEYVKDIKQYLKVKDKITVKVLGFNEKGKFDLSLKQAASPEKAETHEKPEKPESTPPRREYNSQPEQQHHYHSPRHERREPRSLGFEDKISRFLKESEERQLDLKKNTKSKIGKGKNR